MKQIKDFIEKSELNDDDLLLIWDSVDLSTKNVKLANLKAYIGISDAPIQQKPPTTGLVAWWEADYSASIDSSNSINTISALTDQTGTANNNASQSNKSQQPQLINNVINGKPVIRFDGSNDYLFTNGASYAASMIISLFRANTFTNYDGIIACRSVGNYKTSASNENITLTGIPNTSNVCGDATTAYINGQSVDVTKFNDYRVGASLTNLNNFHLIEQVINSKAGTKYWAIGADTEGGTNTRFLNGDIAAILIYNISDDSTRLAARNYLKSKYNLSF